MVTCQQERKRTKSCDLSHNQTMHATYHMTDKVCRKYCKNTVKSGKYMRSATVVLLSDIWTLPEVSVCHGNKVLASSVGGLGTK